MILLCVDGEEPARDPAFAQRYLHQRGLALGAAAASLPEGLAGMVPGPGLGVALAGVDAGALHRGQLAEVMVAYQRMRSYQLAGLLVAVWEWACAPVADGGTVVRMEEPHRFAAKELAPLVNWTGYRCDVVLEWARLAVRVAPALVVALRSGRLDEYRLAVIAGLLKPVTDEELVRHIVAVVLADIDTHTPRTLAEHIQRQLAARDVAPLRRSREQALKDRSVSRRNGPGGVMTLRLGACDAAVGAAAVDHVDAIARAIHTAGDPLGRTVEQLRCDVGLDLLCGVQARQAGQAQPGRRQGTINLTVGLDTLVGLDDDHAVLAGYGPVSAASARRSAVQFADACRWRFQLYDERDHTLISEGPLDRAAVKELVAGLRRWAAGDPDRHPVDVTAGVDGRGHREPTAAQKAFVRARDRHCQYPGCRVTARRCDIDHRVAWSDGGLTVVANLHCLCRAHHRFKHHYGLEYEPAPGAVLWHTLGRRYATLRQPPPGLNRIGIGSPIVELVGYTHSGGPPPRFRQ